MEAKIGINQRIPIEAIELAVKAVLEDRYDNEYAVELARMEYNGENRIDRGMICIALVNAAYPFCYDVTALLGKYFHAQKEVGSPLITSKLSAKYGTNRSLPNGLYCILPMLIEAGFMTRPRPGFYQMTHLSSQTEIAKTIYQKSFLCNNPTLNEDYHFDNNFYFEFVS